MAGTTSHRMNYDGYARLVTEVKRRWNGPKAHPTFMLYFIGSFLIFGAIGVWLEIAKLAFGPSPGDGTAALRTAIATYFPAVLGSSVLQLSISESLRSLRALAHIVAPFFFALAAVLVYASRLENWQAIIIGVLASAGALACWWIVNADEHSLRDDPEPEPEAVGKPDATAPLLGDDALNQFQS